MASRQHLKKLSKRNLTDLCTEQGLDFRGKRKDELVESLFMKGIPANHLTPVISSSGLMPVDATGDLPPFDKCQYKVCAVSELPSPSFVSIYNFMISRGRKSSGRGAQNFKGMDRAVAHFEAGDVQDIQTAQITPNVMYLRAKCLASMKKDRYTVYIMLCFDGTEKFNIHHAYCQCPVGLAQSCSHVGALLFTLNGKDRIQTPQSCTSQPCKWIVPRNLHSTPRPIQELDFSKPRPDGTSTKSVKRLFDPRHPTQRTGTITDVASQLTELRRIFPNTGLAHLCDIEEHIPEAVEEVIISVEELPHSCDAEEVCISSDVHSQEVGEHEQTEQYIYSPGKGLQHSCDAEEVCISSDVHSQEFGEHEQTEQYIYSPGKVPPLTITSSLVKSIEEQTRGQRLCPLWQVLHKGRITSSIFGRVIKAGDNPNSLIRQIIDGSNLHKYSSPPPAVKWGQDNEDRARQQYEIIQNVSVRHTGLTLCESHSFLGTSSDGVVDGVDGQGVLEIKCPYSINNIGIHTLPICDIVSMGCKSFCLASGSHGPRLRQDHDFYAQIQGEMAIMGLPWCDFVVWTNADSGNIFVERVMFDPSFVTNMMPRLVSFYVERIFPLL